MSFMSMTRKETRAAKSPSGGQSPSRVEVVEAGRRVARWSSPSRRAPATRSASVATTCGIPRDADERRAAAQVPHPKPRPVRPSAGACRAPPRHRQDVHKLPLLTVQPRRHLERVAPLLVPDLAKLPGGAELRHRRVEVGLAPGHVMQHGLALPHHERAQGDGHDEVTEGAAHRHGRTLPHPTAPPQSLTAAYENPATTPSAAPPTASPPRRL
jgi:hypothetical protein